MWEFQFTVKAVKGLEVFIGALEPKAFRIVPVFQPCRQLKCRFVFKGNR